MNMDRMAGAAVMGLIDGWLNNQQNVKKTPGVAKSLGIPANSKAAELLAIAIAAFTPQSVPGQYRQFFDGVVDFSAGQLALWLAANSGLGDTTIPSDQASTAPPTVAPPTTTTPSTTPTVPPTTARVYGSYPRLFAAPVPVPQVDEDLASLFGSEI